MGKISLIYRVPSGLALDCVSGNQGSLNDLHLDVPNLLSKPYAYWHQPTPKTPPDTLQLNKRYSEIADVLTGRLHRTDATDWDEDVPDAPLRWAVYGTRGVSWDTNGYRIRYSRPDDVKVICEALSEISTGDLIANLDRLAQANDIASKNRLYRDYREEGWRNDQKESIIPNLVPTFQSFYKAAAEAGETALYWWG